VNPEHSAILPMNGTLLNNLAPRPVTESHGGRDEPAALRGPVEIEERSSTTSNPASPPKDYPTPRALQDQSTYEWHEDHPPVENYAALAQLLAQAGDLYRNTPYAGGLLLASPVAHIPPKPIKDAAALNPVIIDRQRVQVVKDGNFKGTAVPSRHLTPMLASEAFLQQFRPVDSVETTSIYLPDFTLTEPGYNDGGFGQRILHIGEAPHAESTIDTISRFLDVMAFASEADRTNAVAAAVTVMLRNHFRGGKPFLAVTSTKSHGGKETIVHFAAGTTRQVSVSYEQADWALQKSFIAALKYDSTVGLVNVENARLNRGQREIRSAYLERFLTDPEPFLFSAGAGPAERRHNDIVVAITTNEGTLSEDLLNRALPIHLNPVGDVAHRSSPIGNPKLEFLPANRDRIQAELRGMIERWKVEGKPLDDQVKHPFGPWAQRVGGILMVNGFTKFLANYGMRKTADDPVRRGLGLLGVVRRDEWLRPAEWAALTRDLGLVKDVIPVADRETHKGHERGMGVVLSSHIEETFSVETEDNRLVLRLERKRRRFETGQDPQTRYQFVTLLQESIPEDRPVPADGV
jgi:hypothetical protein